jgi:hypothetical protein
VPFGLQVASCVPAGICIEASIGFAFDTSELFILPLVVRPALMKLTTAQSGSAEFNTLGRHHVLCAAPSSACSAVTSPSD